MARVHTGPLLPHLAGVLVLGDLPNRVQEAGSHNVQPGQNTIASILAAEAG